MFFFFFYRHLLTPYNLKFFSFSERLADLSSANLKLNQNRFDAEFDFSCYHGVLADFRRGRFSRGDLCFGCKPLN
jgi:hypothetical protein